MAFQPSHYNCGMVSTRPFRIHVVNARPSFARWDPEPLDGVGRSHLGRNAPSLASDKSKTPGFFCTATGELFGVEPDFSAPEVGRAQLPNCARGGLRPKHILTFQEGWDQNQDIVLLPSRLKPKAHWNLSWHGEAKVDWRLGRRR